MEKALFPALIAKGLEEPIRFIGIRQTGITKLIEEALEMAGCCSFPGTLWYAGRIVTAVKIMVDIDKSNISWVNWSLSNKAETSAALITGAPLVPDQVNSDGIPYLPEDQLTESGRYVRAKIRCE